MSLGEPTSDSTPLFSDDSEAEGPEEHGGAAGQGPQEESASGVSRVRALLTVFILCYINLLNYMDRFTVAGTPPPASSQPIRSFSTDHWFPGRLLNIKDVFAWNVTIDHSNSFILLIDSHLVVTHSCWHLCASVAWEVKWAVSSPPGVLPDIEHYFGIDDGTSGLLQTGKKN